MGETATETATVESVEEKHGDSGPLVFVKTVHEIADVDGTAIIERRTIVYTDADPEDRAEPSHAKILSSPWARDVETDPILLFQFSALTFNAHRIHYDETYARTVEGYPNLVIQGTLTALLLANLSRDHGMPAHRFDFRVEAPFYAGDVLFLRGGPQPGGADLVAYRPDGRVGVRAHVG